MWTKQGEKFNADKAFTTVKEAVKLTTIKHWANQWKHGNNLPACAKA